MHHGPDPRETTWPAGDLSGPGTYSLIVRQARSWSIRTYQEYPGGVLLRPYDTPLTVDGAAYLMAVIGGRSPAQVGISCTTD